MDPIEKQAAWWVAKLYLAILAVAACLIVGHMVVGPMFPLYLGAAVWFSLITYLVWATEVQGLRNKEQ